MPQSKGNKDRKGKGKHRQQRLKAAQIRDLRGPLVDAACRIWVGTFTEADWHTTGAALMIAYGVAQKQRDTRRLDIAQAGIDALNDIRERILTGVDVDNWNPTTEQAHAIDRAIEAAHELNHVVSGGRMQKVVDGVMDYIKRMPDMAAAAQ